MRACSCAPISPLVAQGSRKRPLIPLDDALSASGLQAAAEVRGFVGRAERADHGTVVDPLVAEFGTLDHGTVRSQYRREFALQRPVGGLRIGLIPLRGDLNQVSTIACAASGRGFPGGFRR